MGVRKIQEVSLVLVLGSYDPETKDVLYRVKEEIAKLSTYLDEVYLVPLMLEDVKVFEAYYHDRRCVAVVEGYGESLYTATLVDERSLEVLLVEDFRGSSIEDVRDRLEELGVSQLVELPLVYKFRALAEVAGLVIVVRHKEETRCGEIVELVMLVWGGLGFSRVCFLVRKGLRLSSMVEGMLRAYGIYWEGYENTGDLLRIVRDLVLYRFAGLRRRTFRT
ncbi:MAG: hypothetical protein QXK66_00895 [Sulfolobales archaeon]